MSLICAHAEDVLIRLVAVSVTDGWISAVLVGTDVKENTSVVSCAVTSNATSAKRDDATVSLMEGRCLRRV